MVSGGSATLAHTLWDSSDTRVVGTANETGHVAGPADFAADGYHITGNSAAVQRGRDTDVTHDIDGNPRPMPANSTMDPEADESPIRRYFFIYLPLELRKSP